MSVLISNLLLFKDIVSPVTISIWMNGDLAVIILIFLFLRVCVYVCVHVRACLHTCEVMWTQQNHVAHLLTFVATDVQWQNKDVIAASINFIYKGEKRKAVCIGLHVVCTQQGFDCTKQWNNETNMIPVNYNRAHTYICHRNRRSQVPQWSKMGGSFPSADLLRAEEILRASRWRSDLTDRVSEKREKERFKEW